MLYASDYDSKSVSVSSKNQPYSNKLPRIPITIATSLVNATSIQSTQSWDLGTNACLVGSTVLKIDQRR